MVGRWGVWVCIVMLILGTVSSYFSIGSITSAYRFNDSDSNTSSFGVILYQGSLDLWRSPKSPNPRASNVSLGRHTYWDWYPERSSLSGTNWVPYPTFSKETRTRRVFWSLNIPLIHITLLMSMWAGLVLYRAWRGLQFASVCCDQCGYSLSGLDGGVCPECGAGTDTAT